MTFEEIKGSVENKKIAWLGDGNNIVYSLIEASVLFNFELSIACPKNLRPNEKIVKWAKSKKAKILITNNPIPMLIRLKKIDSVSIVFEKDV